VVARRGVRRARRGAAADVTDERRRRTWSTTAAALGGLRVLVNNVGNYHKGPLAELDGGTWHHMFDSNLHATFYTCQRAVPIMRAAGGGRIVNIGYTGAELLKARPAIVAYQIAKAGVILYTKALARSEAAHGITANVVSPGVMENSVTKPLDELPMGRTGTLDELVGAVRYFLGPEARYVTGTTSRWPAAGTSDGGASSPPFDAAYPVHDGIVRRAPRTHGAPPGARRGRLGERPRRHRVGVRTPVAAPLGRDPHHGRGDHRVRAAHAPGVARGDARAGGGPGGRTARRPRGAGRRLQRRPLRAHAGGRRRPHGGARRVARVPAGGPPAAAREGVAADLGARRRPRAAVRTTRPSTRSSSAPRSTSSATPRARCSRSAACCARAASSGRCTPPRSRAGARRAVAARARRAALPGARGGRRVGGRRRARAAAARAPRRRRVRALPQGRRRAAAGGQLAEPGLGGGAGQRRAARCRRAGGRRGGRDARRAPYSSAT
jgi:3-oxoacyl-[acyl-carrier protein] reductase